MIILPKPQLQAESQLVLPQSGQADPEISPYIQLPLEDLRLDALIACQLFIRMSSGRYIKYRDADTPLDQSVRYRLRENGLKHLYVRTEDAKLLNSYFEANLQAVLNDPKLTDDVKSKVLYTTTVHLVRQLMKDPTSPDSIKTCRTTVESTSEFIIYNPRALAYILDISSTDYYTYTHSVNVMCYSIALATKLGYKLDNDLTAIGQGAIFHDVGKSFIDWEITNKNGPLSAPEFEMMKQHPEFGFTALKTTEEVPDDALYYIRHHHEKLNGKGYPHGLHGSQIELGVRIIACADIFDALTTRRVYREAIKYFPALRMMKELVGEELDDRVFAAFVETLGEV